MNTQDWTHANTYWQDKYLGKPVVGSSTFSKEGDKLEISWKFDDRTGKSNGWWVECAQLSVDGSKEKTVIDNEVGTLLLKTLDIPALYYDRRYDAEKLVETVFCMTGSDDDVGSEGVTVLYCEEALRRAISTLAKNPDFFFIPLDCEVEVNSGEFNTENAELRIYRESTYVRFLRAITYDQYEGEFS